MAKNEDRVHAEVTDEAVHPEVSEPMEPAVEHAAVTDEAVHPEVSEPMEPAVEHAAVTEAAPGASFGGSSGHVQHLRPVTVENVLGTNIVVDPEVEERRERIAAKEAELVAAQQAERKRMAEAERHITIHGLDEREAELDAQLARVRGEAKTEE